MAGAAQGAASTRVEPAVAQDGTAQRPVPSAQGLTTAPQVGTAPVCDVAAQTQGGMALGPVAQDLAAQVAPEPH